MQAQVTIQWKLVTHIRFHFYTKRPTSTFRLFDKSTYTHPDIHNPYGYGRIIRPRTELSMHHDCINILKELNWRCVAHEWSVAPGVNHYGQGDLVFQRNNDYLVMEVKRRNSQKVYKQARYYASVWKLAHCASSNSRVYYGVWTSYNQEIIGCIGNLHDAFILCAQNFSFDRCKELWISNIN